MKIFQLTKLILEKILSNLTFWFLIVFISDRNNLVAEETLNVALNYIRRNPRIGLMLDGIYSVKIGGDDASEILETRMIYITITINLCISLNYKKLSVNCIYCVGVNYNIYKQN
jgi:hypothetical protein